MRSEIVRSSNDVGSLVSNRILGDIELVNSSISFDGVDSVVYCDGKVRLVNSVVRFCSQGGGGLLYLSENKHPYHLDLTIWNNSTVSFGKNSYFNGSLHAIASERQSIVVGDDCLLSFGIWMRTADPHLLYSCETHNRINPSRSIIVGDHVWLGQDSMILKGSKIGSGSVLAAKALLSGKTIPSNQCWGGVPAQKLSDGIFFLGDSVHAYSLEQSVKSRHYNPNSFIFSSLSSSSDTSLAWSGAELDAIDQLSPSDRVEVIARLYGNKDKNRFAISDRSVKGFKMLSRRIIKLVSSM